MTPLEKFHHENASHGVTKATVHVVDGAPVGVIYKLENGSKHTLDGDHAIGIAPPRWAALATVETVKPKPRRKAKAAG